MRDVERGFADLQWCLFGGDVPEDGEVARRFLAQMANVYEVEDALRWPARCAWYADALALRASIAGLVTISDHAMTFDDRLASRHSDVEDLAARWSALARVAREELKPVSATRVSPPPSAQPPLIDAAQTLVGWVGTSEQRHAEELAARLTGTAEPPETKRLAVALLDLPATQRVALRPTSGKPVAAIAVGDDAVAAWVGAHHGGLFLLRTRSYEPAEPVLVLQTACDWHCRDGIGLAAAGSDVIVTIDHQGRRHAVRVTAAGKAEPIPR